MEQNRNQTQPYRLSGNVGEIRLAQLTDCHILSDPQAALKGLNTRHSFEKVLAAVGEHRELWDLVLATGDLSQDESVESYAYLAEKFNHLNLPVAWIPGNHDDPQTMKENFRAGRIIPDKQILLGNWQIVLLDSSISGAVHGRVSGAQLEFMRSALKGLPQQHALVCLHHPAIPCGSAWMDEIGLVDAEQFRDAVCQHNNVRGVLWGHVHQEADFQRDNIRWMSTPSTCVQFKPDSVHFALDDQPPGYRSLILHIDGSIESEVTRVG